MSAVVTNHHCLDDFISSGALKIQNGFPCGNWNDKGVGVLHLRPFNVTDGGQIDLSSAKFIETEKKHDNYLLRDGDVIFNNTNSEALVGKTAYWARSENAVLSNHMTILRVLDPEAMCGQFLAFYLLLKWYDGHFHAICQRHVNQASVGKDRLRATVLPPIELLEQKKIAHILSTVQRAIEAQERIIQTTTELKKALMHKLFTEGLRNEPQKQTEIGPVPESWEVVELNQLADLKNGYAFKSKDYVAESNTLNIRMSNIRPGAHFDLEYNPRFLPDQFSESLKSFLLEDGDLIIAMTDMANDPKILGVPTIVRNPSDKKLLLNQRVGKLVPTDNSIVNLEFLRFYLSRKPAQRYLISCAKKGVQVNIGKKDILSVPIAFPKLDAQEIIVKCFNTLDGKVVAAENKAMALQALFRTLLHELMTAKTRVHELEIST